ncbi:MAG: PVC-type heme-binding CxxCH protein, partial [Verrucomicrobiota bacterium]
MKKSLLMILAAALALIPLTVASAPNSDDDPLRVYIRAGEKSHGPGAHEYPKFLAEWTPMLEERGAVVDGGLEFPTPEQLENTDVLILHAQEAGNINIGQERKSLDRFLKRGGGLVVIHAGAVSRDPDYYKDIIGGSWRHGTTRWLEAPMSLYFTDREHPITREVSNFDIDDEIYYDMDLRDDIEVLAAAYTPKAIDTGGRGNKEAQARAAEAVAKKKGVNIYDIQPQIWTYENTLDGADTSYRAFVHIPGHWHENFSHNGIRTLLLRGIAWAGKRDDNIDLLCKEEELGDALRYVEGGVPRPEELPAQLEVHPEFEISLVASEPLINNPMNIDWDEQGRLWVCETPEYPNGLRQANVAAWMDSGSVMPGVYDRKPLDRISILSDSTGDGVMDTKQVFADDIELATSFVLHENGVIVCAAPDIWLFEDTTGDDVADKRTKLYTNLGTRDTHATINNMRWGRDGWIYATHGYSSSDNVTSGDGEESFGPAGSGVVRFKPDGSAFEQFASKGGNTWGLETTSEGEVFYTQPTTGNPLVHVILPEYILAKGKVPGTAGTLGLLPDEATFPAMNWEQQAYVQIDQVGRYTAGAGCVIYEGGAWPEKWNHSYFTTEPTLNIIGQFHLEPDGITYTAAKEAGREQTEFVRSTNLWFRPIEVRTGPDGALYVVDFCNQAIIHNDTRGPTHGPANAAVRPDRDHYYGRIWRIQHKDAKDLAPLELDRKNIAGLKEAAQSPNKVTRETAQRLLREQGKGDPQTVGSAAVQTYENALAKTDLNQIATQARDASDPWTVSALIAATAHRAPSAIEAAFKLPSSDSLLTFVSGLTPVALRDDAPRNAARLLDACSKAKPNAAPVRDAVLAALADYDGKTPPFSVEVRAAFENLLKKPQTQTLALPIIARWDKEGVLNEQTSPFTQELLAKLPDTNLPPAERLTIARSLIELRETHPEVLPAITKTFQGKGQEKYKQELLTLLGDTEGTEIGIILVNQFRQLPPPLQSTAFDQLLKRTARCQRILGLLEKDELSLADLGPSNFDRLRNHPNKGVARRANAVYEQKNPETLAKNELLAKLIPEVEKQGDASKGQLLYSACAVCHQLGDVGIEVGPALDGMGAHGPAELLVHIIDPNREVDPSFWAHNITTNKGENFAGVITSENATSITLATQIGVKEIAKAEIERRTNTRRSLMPEGFEALGAEGLRDLLAYICGEAGQNFRIIDLSDAYTADSRSGIFANNGPKGGVLELPKVGNVTIDEVPYLIQPPAKSQSGANLVVLKGGPNPQNYSNTFPQSVEIEVDNLAARKLHLLSGIGGWAYPATKDKELPVFQVDVIHTDGAKQSFVMKNGVEFADYIRPIKVAGSLPVEELTNRTQIRQLTLDLENTSPIEKLVFSSFDNKVAPVLVAATAELAGVKQPEKSAEKADPKATGEGPAKTAAAA